MSDETTIGFTKHGNKRANIPPAELEPVLEDADRKPIRLAFERRNRDLDPQLVWRGKDPDQSELTVDAPPIYLQEQVHPKALIDDLRAGRERADDLFGHFGLTDDDREAEVEFYRHSRKWSNRMILGDGLQVMASLAEREGLKGQVQAIYIDPPYGIRFNSNFQWSTTSRDVKDGKLDHLTREPEQVKAFRDTWRDGIHSYLSYLRDRLTVARELLTESGSCFVQIGDENVHRVRALMDEVFGEGNFLSEIVVQKTGGFAPSGVSNIADFIIWFAKNKSVVKLHTLYTASARPDLGDPYYVNLEDENYDGRRMTRGEKDGFEPFPKGMRVYRYGPLQSDGAASSDQPFDFQGKTYRPGRNSHWKTTIEGMKRVGKAGRFALTSTGVHHKLYWDNWPAKRRDNIWLDTQSGGFGDPKLYVVQTTTKIVERCILMTTDPGDLVLDPTCGSGTTAHVAEQWGRRWITIDTSRVALALARARIMGAKYAWYHLADSPEGLKKSAEVTRSSPATHATHSDIRHGFVYERVPHVTLKSIANNVEIDVIWDKWQPILEPLLEQLNEAAESDWQEWEVPRYAEDSWDGKWIKQHSIAIDSTRSMKERQLAVDKMNREWNWDYTLESLPQRPADPWEKRWSKATKLLDRFWIARIARQREIDASIAAKAEFENLYDKPFEDKKRIRVAGPFTVESLSPHATRAVDEHGELIDVLNAAEGQHSPAEREAENYRQAIMENLAKAGVHQQDKRDAIRFDTLTPWPGEWIGAEGRYREGDGDEAKERRAAIFIGPEYGTVSRADLVACAREAADAGFDIVIACAFNFEAHAQEFHRLGRVPILHARMNADLHMAGDLKAGGGNLFVVFGEPDIALIREGDRFRVELKGVDIFRPATGKVETSEPDDIACWFIDTDYSGESFFVRHAYFPGAEVPYKALRSTLKAEIDEEAWDSLKLTVSRPFARPKSGRIAVKVINHLGDEVMKVMGV